MAAALTDSVATLADTMELMQPGYHRAGDLQQVALGSAIACGRCDFVIRT